MRHYLSLSTTYMYAGIKIAAIYILHHIKLIITEFLNIAGGLQVIMTDFL